METSRLLLQIFEVLGVIAIIAGGCLSAFTAKNPSRLASWASAYLVLIVGLFQVVIGLSLHELSKDPAAWLVALAFVTYNLGNAGVLLGTVYKSRAGNYRLLVDGGGGLLAVSMLAVLVLTWGAVLSWQLVLFYIVVVVILVSMPIGLVLSRRHKRR